jgi:hypothetical protein
VFDRGVGERMVRDTGVGDTGVGASEYTGGLTEGEGLGGADERGGEGNLAVIDPIPDSEEGFNPGPDKPGPVYPGDVDPDPDK